jgi:hypothetical protein
MTSVGGQKNALGTGLEHLSTLGDAATALNNTDGLTGLAPEAHLENAVGNLSTANAAKVTALENAADRYAGEVGRLYAGNSGGGVQERNASRARYAGNLSKAELASALETDLGLMQGKLRNLEQQRTDVMGPNSGVEFLGDPQRAAINRVQASIAKLRGQSSPFVTTGGPAQQPSVNPNAVQSQTLQPPQGVPGNRKVIGNNSYIQINGQWFQE